MVLKLAKWSTGKVMAAYPQSEAFQPPQVGHARVQELSLLSLHLAALLQTHHSLILLTQIHLLAFACVLPSLVNHHLSCQHPHLHLHPAQRSLLLTHQIQVHGSHTLLHQPSALSRTASSQLLQLRLRSLQSSMAHHIRSRNGRTHRMWCISSSSCFL